MLHNIAVYLELMEIKWNLYNINPELAYINKFIIKEL